MSGIYIPGVEMPTSCAKCIVFGEYGCPFLGAVGYALTEGRRADDCPLISIPDHGRLIDADALDTELLKQVKGDDAFSAYVVKYVGQAFVRVVRDAPTVIPAEEGE